MTSLRIILSLAALAAAQTSFAHPGHDHSHWSSGLMHLLWIAPVLFAAGYAGKRFLTARKEDVKQESEK